MFGCSGIFRFKLKYPLRYQCFSSRVGRTLLGDGELVELGNRRDLVFCPRDQGGAFSVSVEVGLCDDGGVVVVGTIGVVVCGVSGVDCEDSSHST